MPSNPVDILNQAGPDRYGRFGLLSLEYGLTVVHDQCTRQARGRRILEHTQQFLFRIHVHNWLGLVLLQPASGGPRECHGYLVLEGLTWRRPQIAQQREMDAMSSLRNDFAFRHRKVPTNHKDLLGCAHRHLKICVAFGFLKNYCTYFVKKLLWSSQNTLSFIGFYHICRTKFLGEGATAPKFLVKTARKGRGSCQGRLALCGWQAGPAPGAG